MAIGTLPQRYRQPRHRVAAELQVQLGLEPGRHLWRRALTWALTRFLGWVSHPGISGEITAAGLAGVR